MGFIFDPFVISIFLFAMFIALPIVTNIGDSVTAQVISQGQSSNTLNASEITFINQTGNGYFNASPDAVLVFFYFMLLFASFVSASYQGANPAVTLLLGLFFIIVAELISMGLSNAAVAYIQSPENLNAAPHYQISTYIMEYLPLFNGILTIAYIIYVITKKEVIIEGLSGGFTASSGGSVSQ